MRDRQNRDINYMRISITDRCNLRCRYCMPNGIELVPMEDILTFEEIVEICKEAVALGITRFKITGGEPLARRGTDNLISMIKKLEGVEQVTMTTNGVLLAENLPALLDAGLDAVNISLDTLSREKYKDITGFDEFEKVIRAIGAASKVLPVKINVVLQQGVNDNEVLDLIRLAHDMDVSVRFIELMPIGEAKMGQMISNEDVKNLLMKSFDTVVADNQTYGNGPAVYYKVAGFKGRIGFISAIHGKYCNHCNRIRMTSTGMLKGCLCYESNISVRAAVREQDFDTVRQLIKETIMGKPVGHNFGCEQGPVYLQADTSKMAQIGG